MEKDACCSSRCILNEVMSLLKWCLLAASTVGPGHILVFTIAGTKFKMALMWAVLVSAAVAFFTQECVARLCIVSATPFGHALRKHFLKGGGQLRQQLVHYGCRCTVALIIVGNLAFGSSTLTGSHSALVVLGYPASTGFRVLSHAIFVTAVGTAIMTSDVSRIATCLGLIVVALTCSFGYAALTAQQDPADILLGLLPSLPAEPCCSDKNALSMMGSTGSPFILFLSSSVGSTQAVTEATRSMQRGVFTSNALGMLISVLILIVGALAPVDSDTTNVKFITDVLQNAEGTVAKYVFCISFYVASFSAAMTTFLGASIATRSLLGSMENSEAAAAAELVPPWEGDISVRLSTSSARRTSFSAPHIAPPLPTRDDWAEDGWRFKGLIVAMLTTDFVINCFGIGVETVVTFASMFNGIWMPLLMLGLLSCINDPKLMHEAPQTLTANVCMFLSTYVTLLLALYGLVELLGASEAVGMVLALVGTTLMMLPSLPWVLKRPNGANEGMDSAYLALND